MISRFMCFYVSSRLLFVYLVISCYLVSEIFTPNAYGTKIGAENWHEKMESIYGAGFWSAM